MASASFKTEGSSSSGVALSSSETLHGLGTSRALVGDGIGSGSSSEAGNAASSSAPQCSTSGNAGSTERVEQNNWATEDHFKDFQTVFQTYTHLWPPSDQVMNSKDILPLILTYLKELHGSSNRWKGEFASIIRVNRSFFGAGTRILWHTMTDIEPALKLLPWHGPTEYKGMGAYRYVGGQTDWGRFLLYSPLIRHITLQTYSDDSMDPNWITELIFIPSRPCLFPSIHTITIDPEVPATLPLLQLLVTNALQSIEITACDEDNWHEEGVDEKVQANLPFLCYYAPHLQSFRYKGPVGKGLFSRLPMLKSVTKLYLEWVNPVDGSDLLCLAELPYLRELRLSTTEPVTLPSRTRSPEGTVPWPSLRVVKFTGVEMFQCIIGGFHGIHAHLEDVELEVTRLDKPMILQRTLGVYLGCNAGLETVRMRVLHPEEYQDPWPSTAEIHIGGLSDFDLEVQARTLCTSASNLKKATFEGIPQSLWRFMSSVLQHSVGSWKRLTSLTFRIQPILADYAPATEIRSNFASAFPGLSFLASIIWHQCPCLEFLEFQFDEAKVLNEELAVMTKNAKTLTTAKALFPNGHPLRELVINTCIYEDEDEDITGPTLSPDRKVEIVGFLEQFFPRLRLEGLRGTPLTLWEDMGTWLNTYRKLKDMAKSGI